MAMQAGRLIQDQNFNVHYNGASVGGKTNVQKAKIKGGLGARKPLGDLSNSGNPALNQAPKKQTSKNLPFIDEHSGASKITKLQGIPKLGVVAEQPLHHVSAIAEEQFLHNHQECIKAQTKSMDLDEFLNTVGLDNDLSKYFATPSAPSVSRTLKPENSLKKYHFELEEMAEQLIEDGGSSWQHELLPPCMTPKSPSYSTLWRECDFVNFKLMETPELPRH